jgi:hypothetical protein
MAMAASAATRFDAGTCSSGNRYRYAAFNATLNSQSPRLYGHYCTGGAPAP